MKDTKKELNYIRQMLTFLDNHPLVAMVGDSYDIFNFVELLGSIKEEVIEKTKGGKFIIIRPDSGDPIVVLPQLLESLERNFGVTTNEKGFKVLNNVRLIWGDGINELTVRSILRTVVDYLGYSADNIAFGMGGELLQIVNRDDLKFAMKCSNAIIDGVSVPVFKDPITDRSKKSLAGILDVEIKDEKLVVVQGKSDNSQMKVRFLNGGIMNMSNFQEIQEKILSKM